MTISTCLKDSFPLTAESETTRIKLEGRIAAHNAEVDRLAGDEDELSAVANEDWTAAHRTAAAKVKNRKAELLRDEIAIRRDTNSHLDRVVEVDNGKARASANDEFEAAKRDVAAKLEAIGYVAPDFGMLTAHPRVKAARLVLDSHSDSSVRDARTANRGRLEKAEASLAEMRKREMAVA